MYPIIVSKRDSYRIYINNVNEFREFIHSVNGDDVRVKSYILSSYEFTNKDGIIPVDPDGSGRLSIVGHALFVGAIKPLVTVNRSLPIYKWRKIRRGRRKPAFYRHVRDYKRHANEDQVISDEYGKNVKSRMISNKNIICYYDHLKQKDNERNWKSYRKTQYK